MYKFTIKNLYEKLSTDEKGAMIALYLWCLYCLISPVYIFHSGLPQPADYVMMIACFTLVMHASANKNIKINSYYRSILFLAFGFALYVVLLTLFWSFKLSDPALLRFPVYYSYNVIVLTTGLVLGIIYRERLLNLTVLAVTVILIVQIMYMIIVENYKLGFRGSGFFNNPNQFGYFALLGMVITLASIWVRALGKQLGTIAVIVCVVAIAMSISKAAILGLAFFIPFLLYRYSVVTIFGIIMVILIIYLARDTNFIETMVRQFQYDLTKGDTSFEARGYLRLFEYPKYLIFGAGEGAYYRFSEKIELHSSIGTVLFCYGIPGTILFISMIWRVIRINILPGFILIAPALMYGLAHQGLRFTFFWVTLSCISLALYLNYSNIHKRIIEES